MRKRTSTPERPETPLTRRDFLAAAGSVAAAASVPLGRPRERVADEPRSVTIPPAEPTPFVVAKQGSFMVGGTVVTNLGTFDPIGPAVLVTHSASGLPGWLTKPKSENIRAIVSYEPVGWVFPAGEVPTPIPTAAGPITGSPVPSADFETLTTVPIQVVYGGNIPATPSVYPGLDIWRGRLAMARQFVNTVNSHGGEAELLSLPDVGVFGNTHFAMSDLNNVQVADLLSQYLNERGLDKRGRGH